MDVKRFSPAEVKATAEGKVTAVFSTFNAVDSDGDVTIPGAMQDGAEVVISSYGHTSWQGALPVGKGVIRTTADEAILEGQFFLDTAAGKDTFAVVKELAGRGQWSYGYDVTDSDYGTFQGREVRFLKGLLVHEVSPVLVGAGINTRTLDTKSRKGGGMPPEQVYAAAIRPHFAKGTTKRWDEAKAAAGLRANATIEDLRSVHAFVDTKGDPAAVSSYGFLHHEQPGAEANLRACLVGIAQLNGAKVLQLTPAERKAVYDHLSGHLDDADREVPELKAQPGGLLKFHEEAADVLARVEALINRTSEVMALRREKGKAISASIVDTLNWVHDDMRALRALLDTPQDDADREYARYVASQLRTGE